MSAISESATPPASLSPLSHWSARLQLRSMRLLLLHDRRLFRNQFRAFFAESMLPELPLFQQYQRHIRLLALSDELLGDIMPRIRRQLSLLTNQTRLREEAPTRGDIDWRRTIERGWQDVPGLAPTQFDTRLRQRSTATPENTLVVAILLAYRRELAGALREQMQDEALTDDERQILAGHDERAERELAAAYARTLLSAAQAANIGVLVGQVAARLRPGPNPYRDLITWWQGFHALRIGRGAAERTLALSSQRDDQKTEAWLYELWIALEFVHVLHAAQAITAADTSITTDTLQFCFAWNGRRFRFRYNRQLAPAGEGGSGWQHGPASRPDYTIERETALDVRHNGRLIWREPPVVLDAKYYLLGQDPARTHGPIKKVFGDMLLLGAKHGGLFFPILPEPPEAAAHTRTVRREDYRHHGGISNAPELRLYRLAPDTPVEQLQRRLRAVLDSATTQLPERPPVACHGVWLDTESINASRTATPHGAILCPKPHIGAGVSDLVDIELHCLKDPRLCHVIGQPIIPPLVVRATTREELDRRASDTRRRHDHALTEAEQHGDGERAEQLRAHIFTGIGRTVEQYVKVRGNTASVEELFEHWVFGEYWREHSRCLSEVSRRMLLSGEYVWQEYSQTTLEDWAAPAIQFCRALEHELKRRTYHPDRRPNYLGTARWTLGTPLHAYRNRASTDANPAKAQHNWNLLLSYVHTSKSDPIAFVAMLQRIEDGQVGSHRNTLAHSNAAQKAIAETVRAVIIGDRRAPGVLPWIVEHLDPVVSAEDQAKHDGNEST
ncbi:MAG: hypothetical protein H7Z42_11895 [Roseiflexaceae bacterium]|nr:hypothetical protein [Roseiflexaceae bacterium]